MNITDAQTFNQAVALANQGNKPVANQQLKQLLAANPTDTNLLLWAAFTSTNLDEAGDLIDRASGIEPNSPALAQARQWLVGERAKQPPSSKPIQNIAATPPPFQMAQQPLTHSQTPMHYQQAAPPVVLQSQPYSYTAPVPILNPDFAAKLQLVRIFYGVIGGGVVLTLLSVFLAWVEIQVYSYKVSMNGLGMLSGDPTLINALTRYTNVGVKDGTYILGAAIPLILLVVGGLVQPSKRYFAGVLCALSVLGGLLFTIDLLDAGPRLTRANNYSDDVGAIVGPGMIVGLIGCVVIFIFSIVVLGQVKALQVMSAPMSTGGNKQGRLTLRKFLIIALVGVVIVGTALFIIINLTAQAGGGPVFTPVTKGLS